MNIIAKTFSGLEEVLMEEIKEIGGTNIKKLQRSVSFDGDKKTLYRANYKLRTALKILVPIFDFEFDDIDEFYKNIHKIVWEKNFTVDKTFMIEAVISSDIFRNTQFAALRAKDAIVDRFRERTGERPSIDKYAPQIKINVYVKGNYCNISLDSSGDALFKRGYRESGGAAPINEVLAAGLVLLSKWDKKKEFLDFMCGSGTILIEAAMIGMNIPPQFKRKFFAFQEWKNFDLGLWEEVQEEENKKQSKKSITLFGSDISLKAIEMARENVANSGLSSYIKLKRASFTTLKYETPKHIVFNPPYGKRIGGEEEDMYDFYEKIGDTLKQNYTNSEAWFITGNLPALKHVGLRTSKRIILFNGPIESRFVKYELY